MPDENGNFPEREFIGTTPIKDLPVARGHHIVLMEKEGFTPFERTVSGTTPRIGGSLIDSAPLRIEVKLVESGEAPKIWALSRMVNTV